MTTDLASTAFTEIITVALMMYSDEQPTFKKTYSLLVLAKKSFFAIFPVEGLTSRFYIFKILLKSQLPKVEIGNVLSVKMSEQMYVV